MVRQVWWCGLLKRGPPCMGTCAAAVRIWNMGASTVMAQASGGAT